MRGLVRGATQRFVPEVAFTFNAPNELSRRGSLTVGGRDLGAFALLVRPRARLRSGATLARHGTRSGLLQGSPALEAEPAASALSHREQVAAGGISLASLSANSWCCGDLFHPESGLSFVEILQPF